MLNNLCLTVSTSRGKLNVKLFSVNLFKQNLRAQLSILPVYKYICGDRKRAVDHSDMCQLRLNTCAWIYSEISRKPPRA